MSPIPSPNKPRRVVYKSWAGFMLKGGIPWNAASIKKSSHLEKAAWLTSAVEVGATFGTVQSYDGAGMSAGLEHKIAVLPKTKQQGSLWPFLVKIEEALEPNLPRSIVALFSEFEKVGWFLDPRGILRDKHTGKIISGEEIRNEFSPPGGVVPESGPLHDKALRWIELFSAAFSEPATFGIQIKQAKLGLLNFHKDLESKVYEKYSSIDDASVAVVGFNISRELDLAMCIYHSYSVNAPTKARQVLKEVLERNLSEVDFSKAIVRELGKNTFANWKQRYSRTWTAAKNSNLFDNDLFQENSVAPATLA